MDEFAYATHKVEQLRSEIKRLRTSDFHHPEVKQCLDEIEKLINRNLKRLDRLDSDARRDVKHYACGIINRDVARFHKLLGIILRSTNARNSFEIFDPLLRAARALLGDPQTMLILSSEWEFSPFADPSAIGELPRYVVMGLPVMESANSLIVPLAGHELGHSVWSKKGLAQRIREGVHDEVVTQFQASKNEFESHVGAWPRDINRAVRRESWGTYSLECSERICEEIFCDCVGVRIFGASYLYSFLYLIAPNIGATDLERYPRLRDRAIYMIYTRRGMRLGSTAVKLDVPLCYPNWFSDPPVEDDEDDLAYTPRESYLLEQCHCVARNLMPNLAKLAHEQCEEAGFQLPEAKFGESIYRRFRQGVPAEQLQQRGLAGLADIINAGWMAYLDPSFWSKRSELHNRKFEAINELVFKSLDVMEFEERTGNATKSRRAGKKD